MFRLLSFLLGLVLRIGLFLLALVLFVGMMTLGLLLFGVWLLRLLWAKLTGRPVQPWVYRMDRRTVWQRAWRATSHGQDRSEVEVIDAEVKEVTDVTDVRPKDR